MISLPVSPDYGIPALTLSSTRPALPMPGSQAVSHLIFLSPAHNPELGLPSKLPKALLLLSDSSSDKKPASPDSLPQ